MKTKTLTLLLMLLGITTNSSAADKEYSLNVTLADSTTITCAFSDRPEMLLEDSVITINSSNGKLAQLHFSSVLSWHFTEVATTAISSPTEGVIGMRATGPYSIYSADGQLISQRTVDIRLTGLKPGIYIVRRGTSSFKFTVK